MKHKLVLVTDSDSDPFSGTWYKKGDEEIVYQDSMWPGTVLSRWHSSLHSGGINESDCKLVTGPRAFFKCLFWRYYKRQFDKSVAAAQKESFEKYAAETFKQGQRVELQHPKGSITQMIAGLEHVAVNGSQGVIISQHGKAGFYVRFDGNPRAYFTVQAIHLVRVRAGGQLP